MRKVKQIIKGAVLMGCLSIGLLTPITPKAADYFGGGSIVVDAGSTDDEAGKRYMPEVCINYYEGLKDCVEKFTYDDNGNVTRVKIYQYQYKCDDDGNETSEVDKVFKNEYRYTYNRKGKLSSKCELQSGKEIRNEKYHYDKKGRLKSTDIKWKWDSDSDGEYDRKKYTYDKKGRLRYTKTYLLHFNKKSGKYEMKAWDYPIDQEALKYDKQGRMIDYDAYFDGGYSEKKLYKYDDKGNYIYKYTMKDKTSWDGPWENEETITNKYNSKGRLYKAIVRGVYKDVTSHYDEELDDDVEDQICKKYSKSISYDKYGNPVKEIVKNYDSNNALVNQATNKYKNTYDKKKRLLSSVGTSTIIKGENKGTEKVFYKEKYTYDKHGNVLSHELEKEDYSLRSEQFKNYKLVGK